MYDGGPEACGSYLETCHNCAFADNDAGVCTLSCKDESAGTGCRQIKGKWINASAPSTFG